MLHKRTRMSLWQYSRVVMKRRAGETKMLGNGILSLSNYSNVLLEMFSSSVLKTDFSKANSRVEQMDDDVAVAKLPCGIKNARR